MSQVDYLRHREDFQCVVLAGLGFSTELISQKTGLSHGQVIYRIKKANVKRSDYRDGGSRIAARVISGSKEYAEAEMQRQLKRELGLLNDTKRKLHG